MRDKKAFLVAGLGFGDEGKGTTVDYLTRRHNAHTVIRYNGGPQAAHMVIAPDGRQHIFAQFGSGMLVVGTKTHISRFMLVNPITMMVENACLNMIGVYDAFQRTTIDGDAIVVTSYHTAANRLLEISRGTSRHGSCGMGVGQAVSDHKKFGENVLLVKDLNNPKTTKEKLAFLKAKKLEFVSRLHNLPLNSSVNPLIGLLKDDASIDRYAKIFKLFTRSAKIVNRDKLKQILDENGAVIFEGAQGVLLDPRFGFPPHVTKTKTTFENAKELLRNGNYDGEITKIGVVRGYSTRHGAGPFPTKDDNLTELLPDSHNISGEWQGKFRIGYFDAVLAKRALKYIGGVDEIVMTNLDRLRGIEPLKIRTQTLAYQELEPLNSRASAIRYARTIGSMLNVPIKTLSFGPTARDKITL